MTKNEKIKATLKATRDKRSSQECHVFKCKIDSSRLSQRQKTELKMMFVEGKWIYNYIIGRKSELSLIDVSKLNTVNVLDKDGNEVEKELKYLSRMEKEDILTSILASLKAMKTLREEGYQKHGQLHFISDFTSINLRQHNVTHKIIGKNKMKLQGVHHYVTVNGLKQIPEGSDIANAKILKKPDGYYVAITTFSKKKTEKRNGKQIGIDFGCQTSLTYSDGRKQNVVIEESEHLKYLQRKMSRQKKGSNNRYKTKTKIQRAYQKLDNKKNDISNKIISDLKKYDLVVIQNEQLRNWHENGHGKAVQHSVLGRVKSKLINMDNVLVLSKDIPTTKICMKCGKVHELELSNRIFQCDCGISEDRDVHAAKNMLEIANILKENLVPMERREVKREEFLTSYSKKFGLSYGTLRHEDATFQGCH